MPTDREYVIRREELYEKAWSIPMARLAKEYGISDVALAKICKKLNVPKPQRGYWAKLSANKELKRPLLPKISSSDQKEFIHYERPKPPQDSELDAIKTIL